MRPGRMAACLACAAPAIAVTGVAAQPYPARTGAPMQAAGVQPE